MEKRKYWPLLKKCCGPFVKPLSKLSRFTVYVQMSALALAVFSGMFVGAIEKEDRLMGMWSLGGILFSLLCAQYYLWRLSICHIEEIVFDIESHISSMTLSRITKFSIGQVVNHNSGFKQDTLKKGEAAISELVQTLFLEAIPSVIRVVVSVGALFYFNIWVALAVTVCITIFVIVSYYRNKIMLPALRKNRKKETKISTAYWERIKHLQLIIASAQEKRAVSEFDKEYEEYGNEGRTIWSQYVTGVALMREPFAIVGQISAYGLAGYFVLEKQMPLGHLVSVISLSAIAFSALSWIGAVQRRLARNIVLVGRYFEMLEIPPAVTVIENPVRIDRLQNQIEFRNVNFSYPEFKNEGDEEDDEQTESVQEKPVALQDICVTIRRGEKVALVGPSGSGKTSFVNLLQRGYDPISGEILIDGVPLRNLCLDRWRKLLGIVSQDPKLWDATLRYNIFYGLNGEAGNVTDAQLEDLARMTRIDEFFHRLGPQRFETHIGENGIQLSGGQRQRVALARALIKKPDILILDEATNALDPHNEKLVHEAIRKSLEGRTGIIIAHRLSTIRNADRILFFEQGRIVGNGTHKELMASCRQYHDLVRYEQGDLVG